MVYPSSMAIIGKFLDEAEAERKSIEKEERSHTRRINLHGHLLKLYTLCTTHDLANKSLKIDQC